mgnify:CR=1 FL=1
MTFRRILLLIALTCTFLQVLISEYNLSEVGADVLIETADSPSYISPAKNYKQTGVWKENFNGPSSYVQRPPAYGALYLVCSFFSESPRLILKVFQYLFMGFGIYFFGKLLDKLIRSKRLVAAATMGFGVLPFFHGFVGYIMTEAIAPYLLVIFTYLFVELCKKRRNMFTLLFITVGAVITIFRIQLIIFPVVFMIILLLKYRRVMIILPIMFLPFILWQMRVVNVMGAFDLHPIYSYKNESIFRPPHQSLTKLFKVWEHDGGRFHNVEATLRKDTSKVQLDKALNSIPSELRCEVRNNLILYQQVAHEQKKMFRNGENTVLPIEKKFEQEVENWMTTEADDFFVQRWIISPTKSTMALILSSQLNLFIFQKTFRGNILIESLRTVAVLVILLSVLASTILLFLPGISISYKGIIGSVFVSLIYLAFVQKMNETRYIIPYLPLLFTSISVALDRLILSKNKV